MIKKITALLLVSLMTISLAACGGDKEEVSSTAATDQVVTEVENASKPESEEQTTEASQDDKTEAPTESEEKTGPVKIQGTISNPNANAEVSVKDDGTTIKAITDLKVTKGASISQGIDLKGKKITMAITEEGQYSTGSFKRCVAAFETAYNCKVTIKKLGFGTYNQQVAQAKAAGDVYDICFVHGSYFPSLAFDDIYEPFNDTLRSGDILTTSTSGGIDLNKTSYFVFKNKIWGVCNYNSCFPYLIYYNKKMLGDAGYSGAKDPRKMAEAGKWSWKVIEKMGKDVTDAKAGKYLLSSAFTYGRAIPLSYGAQSIIPDGKGGYKQNITSADYMNALKFKQKLLLGSSAIVETEGTITHENFMQGKVYMWCEESSKYIDLMGDIATATAFGRKKENIGIVEMPLGGTNKDRYPTGWLTAVACGKGKDPRIAIAWDVFRSQYKDPLEAQDTKAFSEADKKYVNDLLVGNIALDIGRFYSSDEDTGVLISTELGYAVNHGADVTKEVHSYKDKVQACINFTLKR